MGSRGSNGSHTLGMKADTDEALVLERRLFGNSCTPARFDVDDFRKSKRADVLSQSALRKARRAFAAAAAFSAALG